MQTTKGVQLCHRTTTCARADTANTMASCYSPVSVSIANRNQPPATVLHLTLSPPSRLLTILELPVTLLTRCQSAPDVANHSPVHHCPSPPPPPPSHFTVTSCQCGMPIAERCNERQSHCDKLGGRDKDLQQLLPPLWRVYASSEWISWRERLRGRGQPSDLWSASSSCARSAFSSCSLVRLCQSPDRAWLRD